MGEVHRTLEFQNMEQALQELRMQLSERTSQLDSYEKVMVNGSTFFIKMRAKLC